jgi:ubiquinone/menaquinone biosynthesis C-methylase UbiE
LALNGRRRLDWRLNTDILVGSKKRVVPLFKTHRVREIEFKGLGEHMDLLYLSDSQTTTFDEDYHSPEELNAKFAHLQSLTGDRPISILDIGGGNGRFLDSILNRFPNAEGTVLDVSAVLLSRNAPHPRKALLDASVEALPEILNGKRFDIITMNWLLHHLVGPTYPLCAANCIGLLEKCRGLLKPDGVLIVTENMFDGFGGTNLPSWVIYNITRVRQPWFVRLSGKFFNTAGVGVCFRSQGAWTRLFRQAGFRSTLEEVGHRWKLSAKSRLLFGLLGIRDVSHRHFYLRAS